MQAHIIGNLVLSMVEVVKLKKLANATNQGLPFPAQYLPEPFYCLCTSYQYKVHFYVSVVLSMVLGLAISVLTGNLLEMQIFGLYPGLQNQKLSCWVPAVYVLQAL